MLDYFFKLYFFFLNYTSFSFLIVIDTKYETMRKQEALRE